ncbi:30S ribosomal protein S4 [Candidatus Woesearchaeota archaeon]|nr:30S ribosomal protein S4 [Candidatus Woesearchaeota archaeon]
MGDPKKPRKKYQTPLHPWNKERIEAERELLKKYGLKNKQEILIMDSILSNMKIQAKRYIAATGKQAEKEKQQLLTRIQRLGFVEKLTSLDDILGMNVEAVMERRLQTQLVRKGLARSIVQSRQFIVHRHVTVGSKVITSPSYLVSKEEEGKISFLARSKLNSAEHPERAIKNEKTSRTKGKQN